MQKMIAFEQIVLNLAEENLDKSFQEIMSLFDVDFPITFGITVSNLIYYAFCVRNKSFDIYLNFMELIQAKEPKTKIIESFVKNISLIDSQEAHFLIAQMIDRNLADVSIAKNVNAKYYVHYRTNEENVSENMYLISYKDSKFKDFFYNLTELSKNDWELHKKYVKEGINPNEIVKIIRNDEIEKLQEISSQNFFDFNQIIKPSLYERCSFINQENVTLIDYAAFFGSVKCFKYLLMNNANVKNTGKYAIAGGNIEIIHLCEQNHSSFKGAYEIAMEYHRNDILKYIYDNNLEEVWNDNRIFHTYTFDIEPQLQISFGTKFNDFYRLLYSILLLRYSIDVYMKDEENFFMSRGNFEMLSDIEESGLHIVDRILNEYVTHGNLYLVKHFLQKRKIPNSMLILTLQSGNTELIKYVIENNKINLRYIGGTALIRATKNGNIEQVKLLLEQKGININDRNASGKTALMSAAQKGYLEIVKLLLEQNGININAKDKSGKTALMLASTNGHIEIVKLLQEEIDTNTESNSSKCHHF